MCLCVYMYMYIYITLNTNSTIYMEEDFLSFIRSHLMHRDSLEQAQSSITILGKALQEKIKA